MVTISAIRRAVLLFTATVALCLTLTTNAHAIEYLKICSVYGSGWYYGTSSNVCINAMTGRTKVQTAEGTVSGKTLYRLIAEEAAREAYRPLIGAAIAAAMPATDVPPGQTFALAADVSTFDGYNAAGLGGAVRITPGLNFTMGIGRSLERDNAHGEHIGLNLKW